MAGKIEYKDLVVGGVWLVRCRVWPPAGMAHSGGGAPAARAVTYLGLESPPDCAEVAVGVDRMGIVVVRCKELLAVAMGCSICSLSKTSISKALVKFKAADENGLMFDALWSGTGVAKDQHTCKLMHAMTIVDQLAMWQGNAPAPGHAARLAALKQALNARASVEIEKALARIACTASSCSRANPITVVAEQLGAQEARLPQLETGVASGHECLPCAHSSHVCGCRTEKYRSWRAEDSARQTQTVAPVARGHWRRRGNSNSRCDAIGATWRKVVRNCLRPRSDSGS